MVPRRQGTMTVEEAKAMVQKQVIMASPVGHWLGDVIGAGDAVENIFDYRFPCDAVILDPVLYIEKIMYSEGPKKVAAAWVKVDGALVASVPLAEGEVPLIFAQMGQVRKNTRVGVELHLPDAVVLQGVSVGFLFRPISIPAKKDDSKEGGE
jgi:hypothetical protein